MSKAKFAEPDPDAIRPRCLGDRITRRVFEAEEIAARIADELWHDQIGTRHLLVALLIQEEGPATHALSAMGVDRDDLVRRLMQADTAW